jgi:hypothetical protein
VRERLLKFTDVQGLGGRGSLHATGTSSAVDAPSVVVDPGGLPGAHESQEPSSS